MRQSERAIKEYALTELAPTSESSMSTANLPELTAHLGRGRGERTFANRRRRSSD
jgi:hypothetical protein